MTLTIKPMEYHGPGAQLEDYQGYTYTVLAPHPQRNYWQALARSNTTRDISISYTLADTLAEVLPRAKFPAGEITKAFLEFDYSIEAATESSKQMLEYKSRQGAVAVAAEPEAETGVSVDGEQL